MNREEIEHELTQLRNMRQAIDDRIAFFEREKESRYDIKLKLGRNGKLYTGIMAEDLKPYVQEWIDRGNTLEALADRALLSVDTIRRILTTPNRIIRITTADALLQALELPHIFNQLTPEPPESKYWED